LDQGAVFHLNIAALAFLVFEHQVEPDAGSDLYFTRYGIIARKRGDVPCLNCMKHQTVITYVSSFLLFVFVSPKLMVKLKVSLGKIKASKRKVVKKIRCHKVLTVMVIIPAKVFQVVPTFVDYVTERSHRSLRLNSSIVEGQLTFAGQLVDSNLWAIGSNKRIMIIIVC